MAFPPHSINEYREHYLTHGYCIQEDVIGREDVDQLRTAIAILPEGDEIRRRRGVFGVRNLLEICPPVRALAGDCRLEKFVIPILGKGAFAVRAVFFDKVPGANWSLFWHQDNIISVRDRIDVPGFSGWSNKVGVWQVQPPADVLGRMIAIRVHLDDCGNENGPLRILPGSHRMGWIDDQINDWKIRVPEVVCVVKSGGVVTMCPLTLHASAPAERAGHRRVIHIEYANEDLPSGLEWNNRIGFEK